MAGVAVREDVASWSDFTEEFVLAFCPENEATTVLMQLDSITIVLKFCQGLNSTTQDRIAKLGMDRPQDMDFNGWFKAA
jgi:hypothetical protein